MVLIMTVRMSYTFKEIMSFVQRQNT